MNAGDVGFGLAAAEALVTCWWLEEAWLVDVGHLVKAVELYPSACSS